MNKIIFTTIAVIVAALAGFFILFKTSPNTDILQNTLDSDKASATIAPMESVTELKIEDLQIGTGAVAVSGKVITANYRGTLTNGKEFDSSYDRGTPYTFTLGAGDVIDGWEKGFEGMKVGGKRKLTVPSSMGYGERGAPPSIPPNATLIFEVELLKVE